MNLKNRLFGMAWLGAASGFLLTEATQAATDIPYIINFDQPQNAVGMPIPEGGGFDTFSEIIYGDVRLGSFPATGSQAAVFNTTGNTAPFGYDQISLGIGMMSPIHYLSIDLLAQNMIGTTNWFSIIFDTPEVQVIRFNPNGTIQIDVGGSHTPVALYSENEPIHLEALADTATEFWTIKVNGKTVHTGPYESEAGLLRSVRLNLGTASSLESLNPATTVIVDNVIVVVPEPSSMALGVISLAMIWKRRRR